MQTVGPLLGHAEHAFGMLWSLGEVGLALTRPHHILYDPDLERVQEDVATCGIHAPFDLSAVKLLSDGRRLTGENPYRFIGAREPERILAYLDRARRNPRRHLIVVCHCYGVPSPRLMRTLFGLERAEADVVTSVMSHHQPGTYPLWPGSGFTSMRISRFVENLRAAVTGTRALVQSLVASEAYETVSVLGFSIGGQLALHLAHTGEAQRALLYCPVTNLATTTLELGLMHRMGPTIDRALTKARGRGLHDMLSMTDPLSLPLAMDESKLHVVVQRNDALARPHQIEAIRRKYRGAGWHEFDGTHLVPHGLTSFHRIVRDALV